MAIWACIQTQCVICKQRIRSPKSTVKSSDANSFRFAILFESPQYCWIHCERYHRDNDIIQHIQYISKEKSEPDFDSFVISHFPVLLPIGKQIFYWSKILASDSYTKCLNGLFDGFVWNWSRKHAIFQNPHQNCMKQFEMAVLFSTA